ncbi:non-ribosomal peptide synthetase [Methylocella silvestris BL2]|uniref:Non-ribosomal peptide synthetase n=1 Tax=Methylocella silvestris (strain DSM 15510 / CIP 108128 / LMG 27833 / NCIMB 13906 / BL2) TaxID=395965 RepID=B8EK24_METSB|nr:Pls/PosA family non-ribosomal peptide synthetase [Methylocella silvestris]ACK49971.1 non-ribosomal peptide synthetase [Methylocella silvestris BL2]
MTQNGAATADAQEATGTAQCVLRGLRLPNLRRDELLCEIFAATVAADPDALAMVTRDGALTYAEVDERAEAIARGLLRAGLRPGDIAGLWMPRGHELLIGQIAIAKIGAAWLPFDGDAPVDRIAVCLDDAAAKLIVTTADFAAKLAGRVGCAILTPRELADYSTDEKIDARALGATPDSPAYLIYTSGSTGTPKGIVITGANICHYLRAANEIYRLDATDVMFQGASVAFDLSMEEIWLPYLVGARLFVATPEVMGEADKLPEIMEANGVTVLDTVPTLLALLPRDVVTLRVIILGGEACPPAIAGRWCKPGRKIFNSYGPTEATVVATIAEVQPGAAVTIGGPIPNYSCYVVDDELHLVAPGSEGELLIGGPGVARGYLKRPELTAEKFIPNPFPVADFDAATGDPVLYRSGDAVAINEAGEILFRGRIDDQVKVRGFRVELGEIEAKLGDLEGVAHAAVVLRNDAGVDQLVAFLVPAPGAVEAGALETRVLRGALRASLPPYMVPSRFESIATLPKLSSGKVDRKSLKLVRLAEVDSSEAQEDPRTSTEASLLAAAKEVLPPQAIPFDADFFTDLGGHSLLAARFISIVRKTQALSRVTLQDVYSARTLRGIGELIDRKWAHLAGPADLGFDPPPLLRRFLCGLAQAVALPIILALVTAQWLGVFVSYMLLTGAEAAIGEEIISLIAVYMCINIVTVAITIAAKWLIIGRTKPGRYPLWGVYYFRWWLARRFIGLVHIKWFSGSPFMRFYLRALGAKVGKDAIIGEVDAGAIDLISFGDGASVGSIANLANARVEGGELIIGSIEIGADAYIGSSCVIEEDVVIGRGAEIGDLSAIGAGGRIGDYESWDGSPVRQTGKIDPSELGAASIGSIPRRFAMGGVYLALLLAIPPLGLLPIFPAFWVFDRIDDIIGIGDIDRFHYMMMIPIMAWPTAFVMVLVTVGFIAACRWIILPRVREGTYSVHSWFYLRKWAVTLATEITLETLSSLYATVYMRGWYRLMGAKIGKDAEISTNLSGRYDLVEIGEKNFIADEVVFGDEEVRNGWMVLRRVKTGPRVFVGNSAVIPTGADIPANALIGIKSKPPANHLMNEGDTWFGSPPIKLPVRQKFDAGGANWTYEAPKWKKFARACFEAVMISMPTMLFITLGTWAVEWFSASVLDGDYGAVAVQFTFSSVAICLMLTIVVIVLKWLTMGRYEPMVKPMWSWWAMRTEAVAVIYWGMAGKVLLDHLRGTPFLPWMMRLFGAKFGKGVYMDMTDITEFDCVKVGDFAALNAISALQTHLYEDRVMKVGRVAIADGVTIGAGSTVLYDTLVGDYARLGPLTLVMKGEQIPPHSEWVGAPAEPKGAADVIVEKEAA